MKKSLQRALVSKRTQRQTSAKQSVAKKLAVVERMRDRKASIQGRAAPARRSGASR
ncbi:MAG: hypothetical protein KF689_01650 [Gemmatimonadaceae bacterium]|nr:hypothetical protein [Gemmatimonadaceae bacterium]MCW5826634.1 hypothetical protein [Gemmatimonadaceae bacterium]